MKFGNSLLIVLLVNCVGFIASFATSETLIGGGSRVKRVANGTYAKLEEFPYIARVERFSRLQCTGVLISEQAALTAQRCIPETDLEERPISGVNYKVVLGTVFQGQERTVAEVKSIHLHDNKEDIAILNFVNPVALSTSIKPVTLSETRLIYEEGTTVYSGGWGPAGYYSTSLRYHRMKIVGNSKCESYGLDFSAPYRLCAQHLQDGICSTHGDTGGPLVIKRAEGDVLLGTLSATGGHCKISSPEIFSSVSWHSVWIKGYAAGNVTFIEI